MLPTRKMNPWIRQNSPASGRCCWSRLRADAEIYVSHRAKRRPVISQGRPVSMRSRRVRERLSDSLPTGRDNERQEFLWSFSSSIEPTWAKRQPSEASASRTALRFVEMASMSVVHPSPAQTVELLLVNDGVKAFG